MLKTIVWIWMLLQHCNSINLIRNSQFGEPYFTGEYLQVGRNGIKNWNSLRGRLSNARTINEKWSSFSQRVCHLRTHGRNLLMLQRVEVEKGAAYFIKFNFAATICKDCIAQQSAVVEISRRGQRVITTKEFSKIYQQKFNFIAEDSQIFLGLYGIDNKGQLGLHFTKVVIAKIAEKKINSKQKNNSLTLNNEFDLVKVSIINENLIDTNVMSIYSFKPIAEVVQGRRVNFGWKVGEMTCHTRTEGYNLQLQQSIILKKNQNYILFVKYASTQQQFASVEQIGRIIISFQAFQIIFELRTMKNKGVILLRQSFKALSSTANVKVISQDNAPLFSQHGLNIGELSIIKQSNILQINVVKNHNFEQKMFLEEHIFKTNEKIPNWSYQQMAVIGKGLKYNPDWSIQSIYVCQLRKEGKDLSVSQKINLLLGKIYKISARYAATIDHASQKQTMQVRIGNKSKIVMTFSAERVDAIKYFCVYFQPNTTKNIIQFKSISDQSVKSMYGIHFTDVQIIATQSDNQKDKLHIKSKQKKCSLSQMSVQKNEKESQISYKAQVYLEAWGQPKNWKSIALSQDYYNKIQNSDSSFYVRYKKNKKIHLNSREQKMSIYRQDDRYKLNKTKSIFNTNLNQQLKDKTFLTHLKKNMNSSNQAMTIEDSEVKENTFVNEFNTFFYIPQDQKAEYSTMNILNQEPDKQSDNKQIKIDQVDTSNIKKTFNQHNLQQNSIQKAVPYNQKTQQRSFIKQAQVYQSYINPYHQNIQTNNLLGNAYFLFPKIDLNKSVYIKNIPFWLGKLFYLSWGSLYNVDWKNKMVCNIILLKQKCTIFQIVNLFKGVYQLSFLYASNKIAQGKGNIYLKNQLGHIVFEDLFETKDAQIRLYHTSIQINLDSQFSISFEGFQGDLLSITEVFLINVNNKNNYSLQQQQELKLILQEITLLVSKQPLK